MSGLHHQRREQVGQDVAQQDGRHARAGRHRRLDVGLLADGQHQRAHQSHHARDFRDHDGDDDGAQAALSVAISAIASSTPGMAISPSMTRMISASTRRK